MFDHKNEKQIEVVISVAKVTIQLTKFIRDHITTTVFMYYYMKFHVIILCQYCCINDFDIYGFQSDHAIHIFYNIVNMITKALDGFMEDYFYIMAVDNKLILFVQNLNSATLKNTFHAASNTQNE